MDADQDQDDHQDEDKDQDYDRCLFSQYIVYWQWGARGTQKLLKRKEEKLAKPGQALHWRLGRVRSSL